MGPPLKRRAGADIGKQQLGEVYARALLNAADKAQDLDRPLAELDELIDELFARAARLEATLASPRLSSADKVQLLDRLFQGRMSELLLTFLKVVAQHGRLDCLREVRWAARRERSRLLGRVEAEVVSAAPLSAQLQQQVAAALRRALGQEVDLQARVDKRLIAGLTVRVGDTVFDASIAHRLAALREEAREQVLSRMREARERFALA